MTPRERFLATVRGQPVDRVPLDMGVRSIDGVEDPAWRGVLGRIIDHVHYSVSTPSRLNRYLVTPPQRMHRVGTTENDGATITTTEIDTPKGALTAVVGRNTATNTDWTLKYPVESLADIDKIRSVPWERPPKLAPPNLSDLPADFGERGIVTTNVSSPMVCVAGMMRYEYFLELCATELDLVRDLTEICRRRTLDALDVLLSERTIEYVWMGGSEWLTPPMGSPKLYEELVQPFERAVIERCHEGGALLHVHCHGNVRSALELTIQRGADYTEPVEPPPDGDITFADAKALAAGRITLGGNIEARILENEDAAAVEAATRAAFEGGTNRMVLATTAGPIGPVTPRMAANYHRMIDVWEELS